MTCILHTAGISNVESIVCDNKERKNGTFQAREEMRKIEYSVGNERRTLISSPK